MIVGCTEEVGSLEGLKPEEAMGTEKEVKEVVLFIGGCSENGVEVRK